MWRLTKLAISLPLDVNGVNSNVGVQYELLLFIIKVYFIIPKDIFCSLIYETSKNKKISINKNIKIK